MSAPLSWAKDIKLEVPNNKTAKINKDESLIQWTEPALKIHNKVRAFTMGPGTYCILGGHRLKIHATKVLDCNSGFSSGTVAEITAESIAIQTAVGAISLLEVQPESKARMPAKEFLKNQNFKKGDLFV